MNSWVKMRTTSNAGRFVIDELRLCYIAEPSLLQDLSQIPLGRSKDYGGYSIIRIGGERYEFIFVVCYQREGSKEEIGFLKYGRYGESASRYVYYKISNPCLYDSETLRAALDLPELLGLYFNNFTAIDVAFDHNKNFSSIIKRMLRNDRVTTILNGKAIKDRKGIIKGLSFDYSSSLSRLHCPTVTIRQAKAARNKEKGITVQSYDKRAEIETHSEKQYILNFHGNPRHLFRLEVRLRYQELKDYYRKIGRAQAVEDIFDPARLQDLFFYHLSSVLRFTKGRKPLAWQDIVSRNGRI